MIIFLSTLLLILLLIFGFYAYLYFSTLHVKIRSKKIIKDIDDNSQYRKTDSFRQPHNKLYAKIKDKKKEELKEEELANKYGQIQRYNEVGLNQNPQVDEVEIVGLAEPVGFWTRFIREQKTKFIMARLNTQKTDNKGFWVNLINAQSMTKGKDQSRGR